MLRPVGPQPPSVYWLRRLLALLVVVALVLAVRWVITRVTSSTTTATPSVSPTPSQTPTPTPTRTPTPTTSSKPTTSATASPTSTVVAVAACTDKDISVTASTDAATYPVGSTPRLRMRIQNTSSKPCKRDVGAPQNELVITSGSPRVWSSDDCFPGGQPLVQTIQPGQSYSVTVTWLGKLSQKGCPPNQPAAKAGSYKVTGRNGTVVSAPAVFSLT